MRDAAVDRLPCAEGASGYEGMKRRLLFLVQGIFLSEINFKGKKGSASVTLTVASA